MSTTKNKTVLEVRHLSTSFKTDRGVVTAVDDVSFDLRAGETLGVVGESGCGKTVTSKSIMRLLPEHLSFLGPRSEVRFGGENIAFAPEKRMRELRGDKIAMIFQEPMTSLNPVFTIGWQLDEALRYHTKLDKAGRRARAIEMLRLVEMPEPERRVDEYPHQLSGGMRQRVMIAMAMACNPALLIADEPTTALDVTIQAQVLDLICELQAREGMSVLLITHDLAVVAETAHHVAVMYAGKVVEYADVHALFKRPRHPYTIGLFRSLPDLAPEGQPLPTIEGIVPSAFHFPSGCRFRTRCPLAQERCAQEEPLLTSLEDNPDHTVACHFLDEAAEL